MILGIIGGIGKELLWRSIRSLQTRGAEASFVGPHILFIATKTLIRQDP